jgi:hypothetical protein
VTRRVVVVPTSRTNADGSALTLLLLSMKEVVHFRTCHVTSRHVTVTVTWTTMACHCRPASANTSRGPHTY